MKYCSRHCPARAGALDSDLNFESSLEECDFEDLQGLLFMFSVCHVIIYVLEGSRFNTQILKRFRVLQAAKHALASSVRSQATPPLASRPHASSSFRTPASTASSRSSPAKRGGILNRNASSVSLMSGLGSYTSLFPGQCTPVTLFAFLDDFSDMQNPRSSIEDSTGTSAFDQSSNLSGSVRPSLPAKGSGPVVVLARPANKSEGSFRKKLQSSLEGQIRFLIKKCRTLAGSDTSRPGSRNAGVSNSAPLFSIDASRVVVLLERRTNQGGGSLEFATSLVDDIVNGKVSSDSLLHESHGQNANGEDIQPLKEFIYRQSDILRGRGGMVANSNSGSAAGVGMVAVAAAAAAASAASGKTITTPVLPSLDVWLSSSQNFLQGVLSAKHGDIEEAEVSKRKSRQRNGGTQQIEGVASRATDPLEFALSLLESGKGLNMKFSTSWCQRALPDAKEVYLKGLPACYPTSQHEAHLGKALHAFSSMVKGPAVHIYMKKLEHECTSVWLSERQQCDAVSLTGHPCVHQRHNVKDDCSLSGAPCKSHSSGLVFLHACACGRSRQLRSDPFDFESANLTSSNFTDCDKFLPALLLPRVSHTRPIQPSSWSLIRIGSARYYEPSKGLLQSGFCATEKFLLKWKIILERWKSSRDHSDYIAQYPPIRLGTAPKVEFIENVDLQESGAAHSYPVEAEIDVRNQRKPSENMKCDDKKIHFGRGLPSFTMKKPFSEVVAGSAAADSGFPPLNQIKQHPFDSEKVPRKNKSRDRIAERVHTAASDQVLQGSEDIVSVPETSGGVNANITDVEPFLQIGSNVVPVNATGDGNFKNNTSLKCATVYVGFEHECPHGHRFLLTPDHLHDLGPLYSFPKEVHMDSSVEQSCNELEDPIKLGRKTVHVKGYRHSNEMNINVVSRDKKLEQANEIFADGNQSCERLVQSNKEHDQSYLDGSSIPNSGTCIEYNLQSLSLDDGGQAFSLLNRNIPIYMNCPYCKISKSGKESSKIKFASTISQLQRIFLVTPPFPVVLATHPVVQFEASCLPLFVPDHDQQLQFSNGCQVILPPDSFLTLRLPFVYGVQVEDGSLHPLRPFKHQPELTAWITKGTTLHVLSKTVSIGESEGD